MATVSIPTILRTHTGGEKSVEAKGATVAEVIDDLDSRHSGLRDRLITNGSLHRFVNIYVDDEDVRFAGGPRGAGQGRLDRDDPAGRRRRHALAPGRGRTEASWPATTRCCRPSGTRPLVGLPNLVARAGRPAVGEAGGPQPDRLDQGPARAGDDRARRGRGAAHPGLHDPGADVGQHRHLAGDGRQAQGLQADLRDAGEHLDRAPPAARDVRRGDHLLARRGRVEPGRRDGQGAGRGEPGVGDALPVRQPGQRRRALPHHRPGDPARLPGDHPLRRRPRHHRHAGGHRPVPAREEAGRADRGRRAPLRRAGLRPAQPGRGLRAGALRPVGAHRPVLGRQLRRAAPHPGAGGEGGHLRRHLHRRDPARRAGRGGEGRGGGGERRHRAGGVRRGLEVPVDRGLLGCAGRRGGGHRGPLWAWRPERHG